MSLPWQTWLPAEALDPARIERLLGDILGEWSSKYLPHPSARLGELRRVDRLHEPRVQWRSAGRGLALGVYVGAEAKLAKLMLDCGEDAGALTPRDREVTDQLAEGCLDELAARLGRFFGLPRDAAWRVLLNAPDMVRPVTCTIQVEGNSPLLQLAFESGLLADLVKAGLAPVADLPPLQRLDAGLAKQTVTLSAVLGRCHLSLADLSGVSEGDVLVLDRAIEAHLELAIDGTAKAGRCTVEHAGSSLALKLVEPIG